MPNKKLPKKLVKKLVNLSNNPGKKPGNPITSSKEAVPRLTNIKHLFSRLNIVDWRKHLVTNNRDINSRGSAVREFNVSRQFPKVKKVVIKKVDFGETSKSAILKLQKFYDFILAEKPKNFVLKKPFFYILNEDFIAMSKVDFLTISEMFRDGYKLARNPSSYSFKPATNLASEKYLKLKNKYKFSDAEFILAVSELQKLIQKEAGRHSRRINNFGNFFIAGYKNKKFIFLQKADSI